MYIYAIILLYLYESLIDTIRESTSLQLRINVVVVNQASITSEFVNIVYSELKLTKTHKNHKAWRQKIPTRCFEPNFAQF